MKKHETCQQIETCLRYYLKKKDHMQNNNGKLGCKSYPQWNIQFGKGVIGGKLRSSEILVLFERKRDAD